MKEEDILFIQEKIKNIAAKNNLDISDKLEKIAKAKYMFFGTKLWVKCPCDPESDRACISKHCKEDIENNGICHCGMYIKKKD